MHISFNGGLIDATDYFSSPERDAGLAWLAVQDHVWHVLLPHPLPAPVAVAYARPVTDSEEPDGWRWRLELGNWHIPLTEGQITGPRPPLPPPGTRRQRHLITYSSEIQRSAGQSFFGTLRPGLQSAPACPLLLVREVDPALKRRISLG
jgi:hypothetical protein